MKQNITDPSDAGALMLPLLLYLHGLTDASSLLLTTDLNFMLIIPCFS